MCGILGQVYSTFDPNQFKLALNKINYRGPDYTGILVYEDVAFGHNRLSILDIDPRSNQPFNIADRSLAIIFNGEIYNFKALKSELIKSGYRFYTESDTEVILYSYKHWGQDCLKKLHGMFAFAILDKENQTLLLARDRFGEKPLFYSYLPAEGLWFGSEMKAIKGILPFHLEIDQTAIIDFLHFGFIPAPKSIYTKIKKLRPGHFLEYHLPSKSIIQMQEFYKVDFAKTNNKTLKEKLIDFNEISVKVASEVSISDVSLGAFLSGGVDSSGSVYYLKQVHKDINTFTAGFSSEQFDESAYASLVASTLGVKNNNQRIEYGDFLSSYEQMVRMYDEPHNDFSFIPTFLICRQAAKFHTVMISGDGSDEIFCGYPRYHKLAILEKFRKLGALKKLIARAAHLLPKSSDLRRQILLLDREEDDFFLYIMSLNFSPDEAPKIYGKDLVRLAQEYSPKNVIQDYLQMVPCESLIQKQRYLDIKMTLADDMLVKVDRASMANSIEVRPFYLHPLITDFAFSLEVKDLVTPKVDKLILKKLLEGVIPTSILYRHKMGFTFPLKELILSDIKPFFDDCVSNIPEGIIDKKRIEAIISLHRKGNRNYVAQLHSIMNLGYWMRVNGITA
jgi:asparagine synthase (glutamine-hydrolysing)